MKYIKCPNCELNLIYEEDKFCANCKKRMRLENKTATYENIKGFTIYSNTYLNIETQAYFTLDYHGGQNEESTSFILHMKNTFADYSPYTLKKAKEKAKKHLTTAIEEISNIERIQDCVMVAVPRAKAFNTYLPTQLYLIDAISEVAIETNYVTDGTRCIQRHTNTKTTHLARDVGRKTLQGTIYKGENANDGKVPYPGITQETCDIDSQKLVGKTIILVDDIYTKDCNIDEDCIQALYNVGVKKVVFYALARTVKR